MEVFVGADFPQTLAAEAKNVDAPLNRKVALLRSVNCQVTRSGSQTIRVNRQECLSCRLIAGTLERDQVCLRAAACQHAKAFWPVSDQLAQANELRELRSLPTWARCARRRRFD